MDKTKVKANNKMKKVIPYELLETADNTRKKERLYAENSDKIDKIFKIIEDIRKLDSIGCFFSYQIDGPDWYHHLLTKGENKTIIECEYRYKEFYEYVYDLFRREHEPDVNSERISYDLKELELIKDHLQKYLFSIIYNKFKDNEFKDSEKYIYCYRYSDSRP
jgi:hypothetical protein